MFKRCNYQPSQLPGAKEVFCPHPALGEPECRLPQKNTVWISAREVFHLLKSSPSLWNIYPTTPGKTWPQTTRRQFCSQWKYMWCSRMLMVHPVLWRGSPLCLWHSSSTGTDRNFSAKCRAVKKMSEKDSSVTTFFNLNLQVKRNINCLFMSSPPTADWCKIQLKVALKCKVGVIICLK